MYPARVVPGTWYGVIAAADGWKAEYRQHYYRYCCTGFSAAVVYCAATCLRLYAVKRCFQTWGELMRQSSSTEAVRARITILLVLHVTQLA